MPHRDLDLEFSGQTFSFIDKKAQRSWTVYPFGWVLKAEESKINLDWEHSGWRWVDPQKVLDGGMDHDCVPKIKNSLQRVYLGPNGMFNTGDSLIRRDNPAGQAFLEVMHKLKNDTENGARILATEALKGLVRILESFGAAPHESERYADHWHALRVTAYHFIHSARPAMNAAIAASVIDALKAIAERLNHNGLQPRHAIQAINTAISERTKTSAKIAGAFTSYVHHSLERHQDKDQKKEHSTRVINIITLSSSSTILSALVDLFSSNAGIDSVVNLNILESRPQCEGASLAASLLQRLKGHNSATSSQSSFKLNLKILPDSHVKFAINDLGPANPAQRDVCTFVLLGADRITTSGHVVNKTGSAILADLSAGSGRQLRKIIVLSETDKIAAPMLGRLPEYTQLMETHEEDLADKLSRQEYNPSGGERHDAAEVYNAWSAKDQEVLVPHINKTNKVGNVDVVLKVENLYFEHVPGHLIDAYICETGEMSRENILKKSVSRAQDDEKLFGNLYD